MHYTNFPAAVSPLCKPSPPSPPTATTPSSSHPVIPSPLPTSQMMAMLGQWLGFDTSPSTQPASPTSRPSPGGIVIAPKKKPAASKPSEPSLRKTKSDELLRDFEVMRFLCEVDELLKEHRTLLPQPHLDRLQTLHAQACADHCEPLSDIIEHFEIENDMLRHRLAVVASPSSANGSCVTAQRNALVC